MSKDFYITTAIDYANGSPHLGHAYEKILTDVIARHQRLMGNEAYFLTGLDEHGTKVQQSALKQGVEPQAFCDKVAEEFHALCQTLNLSHDDFIRTTEERHKSVVQHLLQELYDKGEIYQAEYQGYYSVRAEQFVLEKEKDENGKWPEIYGEVIEISEANYFFRISKYQDWLISFLNDNPDFIFPAYRQKQVIEFLKEPLNDLCISRPKERLSWGIELPFDTDYVTYVWFDALTNYISAIGYNVDESKFKRLWPVDYHVIGKDILVPSHSVYWPIMLKAAGIPLPKHLLVHGWWLATGGKKFSKTKDAEDEAQTVKPKEPLELMREFGTDAFRYFVIREMNVGQDSEFSEELYMSRYKSDLGNDLGNLVNRVLNMGARYCDGVIPAPAVSDEPEQTLQALWAKTKPLYLERFDGLQFHTALDELFSFIRGINRYAETRAPWKLAKSDDPDDRKRLDTSIACMAEGIRLAAVALTPVMPEISSRMLALMGQSEVTTWGDNLNWSESLTGAPLGEKTILFPRPPQE